MPKRACLVAIATARQESGIRVLANTGVKESYNYPHDGEGSDHDSVGIFQQRPGWGSVKDRMDPVCVSIGCTKPLWDARFLENTVNHVSRPKARTNS